MKMKNAFKCTVSAALLAALPWTLLAQDSGDAGSQPAREYVKNTFENGVVIGNQTIEGPGLKGLDFMIQHRFGVIDDEKDLFGIYGPANIRLGLTYGFMKNLSVGLGVTKNKMQYDLNWKYAFLRQTKGKGIPVTLAYCGNLAKSTIDDINFLDADSAFKQAYKVSYYHELMIARKVTDELSLQLAGTYAHYNIVDSIYGQHDFYGVAFTGRYRFSPQSSVIFNVDYLMNVSDIDSTAKPKPVIALGYEVSTGSHQFQVFVSTASGILNQDMQVFNLNDISDGDVLIGFNITRVWGF